jgi:hypothetical protein
MARKRMIDPHFWETAQDNSWTSDDCTVMMAAISAADDEGRGRVKSLKDNVGNIISSKKLSKSLRFLHNSIILYDKIYYFLPNFLEYQTISHPTASKFPKPKINNKNELIQKNSRIIPESFQNYSIASEVKVIEDNLKEVGKKQKHFFSENHFEKIKALFATHTKISDPNRTTHIEPVLKFFSQIPEKMTEKDIEICITETFSGLNRANGVRIDLLCTNIQQKITAKHEQILNKLKENELNKGKDLRKESAKDQAAADQEFKKKKLKQYKAFYEENSEKFTIKEKTKLLEFFSKGNWMQAGEIIEPKMK